MILGAPEEVVLLELVDSEIYIAVCSQTVHRWTHEELWEWLEVFALGLGVSSGLLLISVGKPTIVKLVEPILKISCHTLHIESFESMWPKNKYQ